MKKSGKSVVSREDSLSNFFQNYEVQAEQLKYAVRKEVEEANLIAEAMKSLQRSFKVEEAKRKRAEENSIKVREQLKEFELQAKLYKEKIREKRKEASMYTNEPVEDSDDEEDEEYEDLESDTDALLEEDEYEELIKELSEDKNANPTNPARLQIISETFSQSLKEKQKQEKQMNRHKELIKLWLKREKQLSKLNVRKRLPPVPSRRDQKGSSDFQTILYEFAADEEAYTHTMNNIFKNYITPLLSVIPSYELNAIFSNFIPLITIQNQFKDKVNKYIDHKCQFYDITSFLEVNSTAYQEYVDNREHASKSLENLLENSDITLYFEEKFNMKNPSDEMSILLDSPIVQLCKYANLFSTLLHQIDENKAEFEYISTALAVVKRVLVNSKYFSTLHAAPAKANLIEIQNQFDWRNKGGTFVEPHRKFIDSEILKKQSKSSKDKFKFAQIYLFNDALLFTRKLGSKLIFQSFIPIENVLIWDLPDRINSKEHYFQLVNCENSKKYTIMCDSVESKAKWVKNITKLMIDFNPFILDLPSCIPLL